MSAFRRLVVVAVLASGPSACGSRGHPTDPRMVSEWMHTYYGLVRAERLTPPVATRLMAYAAVALYQGLSAATPSLPSLAGQLNGLDGVPGPAPGERYDATLVALAAEHVVLDSMFREALPTTRATLSGLVDSLRQERVALGIGEPVRRRSEELGSRIGQAIVAWAAGDGFDSTRAKSYTPPRGPGFWVNDAPASIYASQNLSAVSEFVALDNPNTTLQPGAMGDRALIQNRPKPAGASALPAVDPAGATEPYWGTLRPFVLRRYDECPIVRPPSYSTDRTSPLYRENQEVVEVKRHLTEEQKAIALYWADNPGETGTPAGHWLAIASQLASQRGLSAEDAVRLFLLTAVAQADAFIAAWGYKYQFNLIRPRTYIRRVIDPAWEPLVPTPPFPEYPSGHSTQSAAASAVLGAVLGQVAFEDSTGLAIGHPVRRFRSFDEAADEAGWSRIYGGIHYHVGKSAGKAVGQCVGAKVIERLSRVVTAGSEAEGRGP